MSEARQQKIAELSARAMFEKDRATPGLGIEIVEVLPGRAVLKMTVEDRMLNGHDTCHGGIIFTLADSTFGAACNSYNNRAVAQMASITFLIPPAAGDVLTATAREITRYGSGERNGIYDVRVENQNNQLVAEFRGHSRIVSGNNVEDIDAVLDEEG